RTGSLDCERFPIERDIFVKIVEVFSIGIALERLSRGAVRKNDVMAFKLDMEILKAIRVCRFRSGDTASSFDQITRRNQQNVNEKAVPIGHVKVAVRQHAIKCTRAILTGARAASRKTSRWTRIRPILLARLGSPEIIETRLPIRQVFDRALSLQ